MKYKGRKKYSQKEAGEAIEQAMQMYYTYCECVLYWETKPRTRSDVLIEAMCNETREEMIKEGKKKIEYIKSKLNYLYQFCPDYQVKGSFAIM